MSNKKKKLVICGCESCPYFDYEYYDWLAECEKLNCRHIDSDGNDHFPIPDDCPLDDAEEEP